MGTRHVEDLAPGDRISVDGLRAVVRKAVPAEGGEFVIQLVNSSDESRTELRLAGSAKVEIL
ncbi:hypothetical protein ACWDTI_06360 [Gordonia sp. NPDC003424]